MAATTDLLAGADWECASSPPGQIDGPGAIEGAGLEWLAASVPGTAAGALRTAGRWTWGHDDEAVLDGQDWWWRTTVDLASGGGRAGWVLDIGGLATVADVWLDGEHVLHSENMFVAHQLDLPAAAVASSTPAGVVSGPGAGAATLLVRCAALSPLLRRRRPRPRWRALLNRSQNQRWFRTSLLGRNEGWTRWAAPVGPWRPVSLRPAEVAPIVAFPHVRARLDGDVGTVDVELRLRAAAVASTLAVRVGAHTAAATVDADGTLHATVVVPGAEPWWPHTHGTQPLYPITLELDGSPVDLGRVGFRTVRADTTDDGYALEVNGRRIFCRGACWGGPDAVSLVAAPGALRSSLEAVRASGMNMIRIGGYTVYEGDELWDLCDELGILVWQDCMLAAFDPPEDPEWVASLETELTQVFTGLGRHPALALVCGSSETYQQAAMFGLAPSAWASPVLEDRIPTLAARLLPGVPYLASTPCGGDLPFHPDRGVAHYFGVSAYLRPVSDVRSAGVRFAAECLAFGTPPEQSEVEASFGSARLAGHDPRWKAGVARDAGTSWDFEDVRDHYVRTLFGVDPVLLRYEQPELALDFGRAAIAEVMATVLAEWRRPSSLCAGALVLTWRDLWPGAGWGLVDHTGTAKAPWYALRRVLAPVAVTITDDGLAGLRLQVHNDRPTPLLATLRIEVFSPTGVVVERAEQPVEVAAAGAVEVAAVTLLGGFRDLNRAYRFGPPGYDVVAATLQGADGSRLGEAIHLCGGPARSRDADVGLSATARSRDGGWILDVSTERFAQYVVAEVSGGATDDRWFHLAPGARRLLTLEMEPGRRPAGSVRALNSQTVSLIAVD